MAEPATCHCADWLVQIMDLNRRSGRALYDGKPFRYCPWCGDLLLWDVDRQQVQHGGE